MSEQILPSGTWVVGTCRGCRVESFRTAEGHRDRHLLGIEVGVLDDWGIRKSEVVEIRISDALVRDGIPAQAQALINHHVAVPVFVRAWTGKRGAGFSLMMSDRAAIAELD